MSYGSSYGLTDIKDPTPPKQSLKKVDRLEFTILVDNSIEWMTKMPPGFGSEIKGHLERCPPVDSERTGVPILDLDEYCCGGSLSAIVTSCYNEHSVNIKISYVKGAHGLAIVITTESDGIKKRLLFDSGPDPRAIQRNIAALGVPVEEIDRVVLSHWHRDHSGGIIKILELRRQTQAVDEVVVDVHPDRPTARGIAPPPHNRVVIRLPDDPTFEDIQAAGGRVERHAGGHVIQDGTVFVSGEIPRVVPHERGLLSGSRWIEGQELEDPRWKKLDSLVGAENPHVKGRWIAEPDIMDERYAAVDVLGKGLVLFSSCSHAGICNVVTDAMERFGRPVYMIVGGLHLAGPELADRIRPTVEFFASGMIPGPTYVLPLHCTGFGAKVELAKALGEGCVPAGTGNSVEIKGDGSAEEILSRFTP